MDFVLDHANGPISYGPPTTMKTQSPAALTITIDTCLLSEFIKQRDRMNIICLSGKQVNEAPQYS